MPGSDRRGGLARNSGDPAARKERPFHQAAMRRPAGAAAAGGSRVEAESSTTVNPMPASRNAASAAANGSGRPVAGRSLIGNLVNMFAPFISAPAFGAW